MQRQTVVRPSVQSFAIVKNTTQGIALCSWPFSHQSQIQPAQQALGSKCKWAQERTGAREGDMRGEREGRGKGAPSPLACLLLARAFFLAPIYFLAPATQAKIEMDYPRETSLCTIAPFPTATNSPVFSEWRGRLYTSYRKRIIHLQTIPQN